MDAGVKLATSDEARWEYVAERLTDMAVILERVQSRLDAGDKRMDTMERKQERAEERALDHPNATESTQAEVAQATQVLLLQQLRKSLGTNFSSSITSLAQNWPKVVAAISILVNAVLFLHGHVSLH